MSMTAAWLTDNREPGHGIRPRAGAARRSRPTRLPPLVPSGSIVGTVREEVAEQIGIPATAQVVTGSPDLHSAAFGAGAVRLWEHASLGTTAWISCPMPADRRPPLDGRGAGVRRWGTTSWRTTRTTPAGARMVPGGVRPSAVCRPARPRGRRAPPGAGGVCSPWLTGERSPVDDRATRGTASHNVPLDAGRGLATRGARGRLQPSLAARRGRRFTGRRLDPIRLLGGGARSDLWCQIVADVGDGPSSGSPTRSSVACVGRRSRSVSRRAPSLSECAPGSRRRAVRSPTRGGARHDRLFREFPRLHARPVLFAHLNR